MRKCKFVGIGIAFVSWSLFIMYFYYSYSKEEQDIVPVKYVKEIIKSRSPVDCNNENKYKAQGNTRLYIAVISSINYLKSRAISINNTWAQLATDSTTLHYYVEEGYSNTSSLPVISLSGADGGYPPLKKVFKMHTYMYKHFVDDYDWFMRADDDLYVFIPKIIKYLSHLDPSKQLYIGSPGYGRPNDKGYIKLGPSDAYCMGGPGVIMSRGLLIRLGSHLEDWLQNYVVSLHDDVEIGKCAIHKLGIQCTKSIKMTEKFYHDYTNGTGVFKHDGKLKGKIQHQLKKAFTFHPLKTRKKMNTIHKYFTLNI